ncbi:RICIN domain-containing protein [Fibrella sp. HMF5335]|uniref:RICIN domain-containing protein n=1 Tax=Fibrella rubiginis TaxID=2817060 RepID=A0A939K2G5_9BACT|nr:RICIN domain-containing protein [Fibrella rubiginis]MBO0936294.1 RICIN domain-containing protein [Fibrella rubiginis]
MFTSSFSQRIHRWQGILFTLLSWLLTNSLHAQSLPTGFFNIKTQEAYIAPMGILFTPDGQRQFVWDKAGRVYVSAWNGTQYIQQTAPALDISEEVGNWRDFGLLSLCLDPNYTQNGLVYLYYMVDRHHLMNAGTAAYSATKDEYFNATISRVTRYKLVTVNGLLTTDATSRKVLLGETPSTGVPLLHESHAGGTLVFGRDGTLLLSTGDNASYNVMDTGSSPDTYFQTALNDGIIRPNENVGAFRAQLLNSHCGKVLRMDPTTGDGLPSNPFYDATKPRSPQSRVWTLGLRNPYRMTLQPGTGSTVATDGNPGTLLIGDVGWGTWEDMQIVQRAGENAGWPIYEGLTEHSGYATAALTLENKDEPNPASTGTTGTCPKPYLMFADLLKQATNPNSITVAVTNPCSNLPLPGLQRRYVHSRPALDWSHTQDIARSPTFSGALATATTISQTATTGTVGAPFRGNAATAGAYYNGTVYPTAWQNTYFFADYGANWIRAATLNANGTVSTVRDFLPNDTGKGIVDVEMNPLDGALYYVNINTGEIMKIAYAANRPPVAIATATSLTGTSPLSVTFTGSASTDPDGDPLTYEWDFGDGSTFGTTANPVHVFEARPGKLGQGLILSYTVQLKVTDNKGLASTTTLRVSLNNLAPTAKITSPVANALYPLDKATGYTLTANTTDEVPTTLVSEWQVILRHNNHEHREPVMSGVGITPVVTISPVGCDGETYYYFITLKVTDAGGLTAQDSVKIYPDCNSPKLAITGLTATTLANAVRLNWVNPAVTFDNVLVAAKAGSGFTDRPTDLVYPADPSFTGAGADFFGGKVVYQGLSTSLVVTSLTPGTRYYFRVYTRRGSAWTGGVEVSATPATAPTSASVVITPNTCYRLTARVSGKVLGVEAGNLTDGGTVRQRTDANQAWQQWKFTPTSDGYYQVIATHSNKVLDVQWGLTSDGAPIQQWAYAGAYQQQWTIRRDAEGYYQLMARHSGKLLNVQGSNQTEGGVIDQSTANATQAQQWRIEPATCVVSSTIVSSTVVTQIDPAACYVIQSRSSGKVLGVTTGQPNDGALIRQYANTNQLWQQWRIQPTDPVYYRITVLHTGKGIDVPNASTADQSPLQQWTYWGGSFQQWVVQRNAAGFFTFTNRNSGMAIAVKGANTTEGGDIVQATSSSTATSQQWTLTTVGCPTGGRLASFTETSAVPVFQLWPNPAQDFVQIDLKAAKGQPTTIGLTDLAGRSLGQTLVDAPTDTPYQLNTGTLANGLYLISITPAGQPAATTRLLIQR